MKITFEITDIADLPKLQELLATMTRDVDSEVDVKIAEKSRREGTPIEALKLTTRSVNCLKAKNIYTIRQLVGCSKRELLKTPNLGLKSMKEIEEALNAQHLSLRG